MEIDHAGMIEIQLAHAGTEVLVAKMTLVANLLELCVQPFVVHDILLDDEWFAPIKIAQVELLRGRREISNHVVAKRLREHSSWQGLRDGILLRGTPRQGLRTLLDAGRLSCLEEGRERIVDINNRGHGLEFGNLKSTILGKDGVLLITAQLNTFLRHGHQTHRGLLGLFEQN